MGLMISLSQVRKRFGRVEAVRGVSLEIPRGQVVGILGPNGAGKTTTIRMIAAAIPPTEGAVRVAGLDAVGESLAVRRRLGYMPESAPLYREMRVRSFLRYRAGLYGLTGRLRGEAVGRVVSQCRLEEVVDRRCGELSKGYRQRVSLASALVHEPEVLILDEPTSGLDPAQIAETRGLIRGLAGSRTMLIVSHILPEVERLCDRIVVFMRGEIRADGSPRDVARQLRPRAEYVVEACVGSREPGEVLRMLGGAVLESEVVDGDWRRCVASFSSGAGDQREAIARALAGAGLVVRELRAGSATLEEAYLRLVAEEAER